MSNTESFDFSPNERFVLLVSYQFLFFLLSLTISFKIYHFVGRQNKCQVWEIETKKLICAISESNLGLAHGAVHFLFFLSFFSDSV